VKYYQKGNNIVGILKITFTCYKIFVTCIKYITNKEIYSGVKKPTIIQIIKLNRLHWFGHVHRMEENRIPKRVLYMNLGTRLRDRPRNRWQNEVREDGKIVGGEGWQEKVHNREEWKKLLRTARNHRISAHANGMNEQTCIKCRTDEHRKKCAT